MKKYRSVFFIVLFFLLLLYGTKRGADQRKADIEPDRPMENSVYAGVCLAIGPVMGEDDREAILRSFMLKEQDVYSFLQGPRSWREGIPWSGEWCQFGIRGNSFGSFGCGLCCMANIYDTLSPYEVSPWDMFEYARVHSGYSPDGKHGAIDWGNMKEVLKVCGVVCDLYYKPQTYEEFQQHIIHAKTVVALVCSGNDDTYWKDIPGHYVNLWMYEEDTDTVFLSEPGSPENNRTRIPLRYVYDALKVSSNYQYLLVSDYIEEKNQWKVDGIDEAWNRPW